jgi:hypothetical protein
MSVSTGSGSGRIGDASLGTWRTRSNARLAGSGRWERANGIGRGDAEIQAPSLAQRAFY